MKLQLTQDLTNILNEMNFKRWGKRDTNANWESGTRAALQLHAQLEGMERARWDVSS